MASVTVPRRLVSGLLTAAVVARCTPTDLLAEVVRRYGVPVPEPPPRNPNHISIAEAARLMDIHKVRLYQLIWADRLPAKLFVRLEQPRRLSRTRLLAWIKKTGWRRQRRPRQEAQA
jgi:hypothetical protein